jgi:NitT/TauT family transport system ATP-binding protein
MAEAPIIAIDKVSKIYGGANATTVALQEVSLTIQQGELVSLVGPSGCGKSTLLRLIADLDAPSQGQISINGHAPVQARKQREYGFVFQAPTLYDWRTVERNARLPLEVMGRPMSEWQARLDKMLAMVGLRDFYQHYPWQLSGGMQQRASIARALAFDPAILLMDEPFGALDEFTRERMNMELLDIWETTHKTILFVTHSIAEAVFLASRIIVMTPRPGRIASIVDVDLPYPRNFDTRESPRFFELVTQVRETLKEEFVGHV